MLLCMTATEFRQAQHIPETHGLLKPYFCQSTYLLPLGQVNVHRNEALKLDAKFLKIVVFFRFGDEHTVFIQFIF